jgi:hypothetical protein
MFQASVWAGVMSKLTQLKSLNLKLDDLPQVSYRLGADTLSACCMAGIIVLRHRYLIGAPCHTNIVNLIKPLSAPSSIDLLLQELWSDLASCSWLDQLKVSHIAWALNFDISQGFNLYGLKVIKE